MDTFPSHITCMHACYAYILFTMSALLAESLAVLNDRSSPRGYECKIQQRDLPILAGYFDDVECYLDAMELSNPDKTDVRRAVQAHGTQVGMNKCLDCWQQRNPSASTFGALLNILLELKKGAIAVKIYEYMSSK